MYLRDGSAQTILRAATGPTSPSADPITPGAWQGSHWSANFEVTAMTRPRKKKSRRKRDSNPGSSALEADALTTRPTRRCGPGRALPRPKPLTLTARAGAVQRPHDPGKGEHFPDEVDSASLPSLYHSLVCQLLLLAQAIQTTTECLPLESATKGCTFLV